MAKLIYSYIINANICLFFNLWICFSKICLLLVRENYFNSISILPTDNTKPSWKDLDDFCIWTCSTICTIWNIHINGKLSNKAMTFKFHVCLRWWAASSLFLLSPGFIVVFSSCFFLFFIFKDSLYDSFCFFLYFFFLFAGCILLPGLFLHSINTKQNIN